MQRVTRTQLKLVCDRLNRLTNSPTVSYDGNIPQVGNYNIERAYGGYALRRFTKQGEIDVFNMGYATAREMYNLIHAYVKGVESVLNNKGE